MFLTLQRYGEKAARKRKEVEKRFSTSGSSFPAVHGQIFHLLSIKTDGNDAPRSPGNSGKTG